MIFNPLAENSMRHSTPMLPGGIGPDPRALAAGRFNPRREGKVLAVILNGDSDGTNQGILNFLLAHPPKDYEGKLREPTVRYFTKRAVEAGIIEARQVAGKTVHIPLADGPAFARATPKGLAFRAEVLRTTGEVPTPVPLRLQETAAADAAETATIRARQQGFSGNSEERRAIELRAMAAAIRHFTNQGYRVHDVSSLKPYDLHCERGTEELHVEVKGTASSAEAIFLTAGEVAFASAHPESMALFVLRSIDLTTSEKSIQATGGYERVLSPWRIEPDDLAPLAFRYRLPAAL